MNECFQITLGCYGSVCACARAPVIAYLRDAGDAALELLMMLQKTGSSNKALRWNMLSARWTRRAQTTKQVQAGSCAALPPLGCLLFQRHTADTRFSFISSQEQWLSAHCVVYVFAFSPVPAVCPVALSWLETAPSGTSLWAERDCAAGRASSSRCVVRQCDGGAINTPQEQSIHPHSPHYLVRSDMYNNTGFFERRGDRGVTEGSARVPEGKHERGVQPRHKAQKGLEQNIFFSLFLT